MICHLNCSCWTLFFFTSLPLHRSKKWISPRTAQTPEEPVWECKKFWFLSLVKATKNFQCETNLHLSSPLNLSLIVSYKSNMLGILSQENNFISVLYFKIHSIKISTLRKILEVVFQKCFDIYWNDSLWLLFHNYILVKLVWTCGKFPFRQNCFLVRKCSVGKVSSSDNCTVHATFSLCSSSYLSGFSALKKLLLLFVTE